MGCVITVILCLVIEMTSLKIGGRDGDREIKGK